MLPGRNVGLNTEKLPHAVHQRLSAPVPTNRPSVRGGGDARRFNARGHQDIGPVGVECLYGHFVYRVAKKAGPQTHDHTSVKSKPI